MMANLRDLGVHASEEGGNPLTDAASVTSALALLRLCDNPGNTVARYHVACTPVGAALGYTDHLDESATLALAAEWRRRLLEDGYGATLTELAGRIADACDGREQRRMAQLVELAFRFEDRATLRPSDFVQFVRRERVEDPVAAQVRVMTVHQAKGLEFDVVVLPELDAPLVQGRYTEVLSYRPKPGAPVTRAFPFLNKGLRALFPELAELTAADEQAFRNELRDGLSTMYVALTRARHALHIIAKPNQGNSRTAARVLLRALAPGRTAFADGDVVIERGNAEWYRAMRADPVEGSGPALAARPAPTIALRPTSIRTRALPRRSPSQLEGDGRIDLGLILRLTGAAGRGSVAHRWFEEIGWLEDGVPDDGTLAALAARLDAGLEASHVEALVREFRGWLAEPQVGQLLTRARWPAGSTVEREVPFLAREGDVLMEGFIDRLVLTRTEGRITSAAVIDFKTDAIAKRAELAQRTGHYRPQLEAYRRAVCAMYGLEPSAVEAWLVFLEAGQAVRLAG
jgi:ATP-dependent exoDNAse (exonuclease V) beta subunit